MLVKRFSILLSIIYITIIFQSCDKDEPDYSPPPTVQNFRVLLAQDLKVQLAWSASPVSDFYAYVLTREDSISSIEKVLDTIYTKTDTTYLDIVDSYDISYTYRIYAIDINGNISYPAIITQVSSGNSLPPSVPDSIEISAKNNDGQTLISLSWKSLDYDIDKFVIIKSWADTSDTIFVDYPKTSYIDTNITIQTRYYYKIQAVDLGGKVSSFSQLVSDIPLLPPELLAPEDSSIIADSVIEFSWKKVDGAVAYKLYISATPSVEEFYKEVVVDSTSSIIVKRVSLSTLPEIKAGETYYWAVATLTKLDGDINSVSKKWMFIYKPASGE